MMRPLLHMMPRAISDLDDCLRFVSRHPASKPKEREEDVYSRARNAATSPIAQLQRTSTAASALPPHTGSGCR